MFHRHTWEIVSQVEQNSPAEISTSCGMVIKTKGAMDYEIKNLCTRPVIVRRKCTKCETEDVRRV